MYDGTKSTYIALSFVTGTGNCTLAKPNSYRLNQTAELHVNQLLSKHVQIIWCCPIMHACSVTTWSIKSINLSYTASIGLRKLTPYTGKYFLTII